MTKLLRGLGAAVTFSAHMAATPIFGPKISNFLNMPKTMLAGALLVATSLLSTRISFLLIIGQRMAGLWAKKACEADKFIGNIELMLRFWAKSGANKLEQQPNLLIFS